MSSILTSPPPSPSLVPLGNSRAASTLGSNELKLLVVPGNIDPEAKSIRHSQYYFKDRNIIFLASQCLDSRKFNSYAYPPNRLEKCSTISIAISLSATLPTSVPSWRVSKEPKNRTQSYYPTSTAATSTNSSPFFILRKRTPSSMQRRVPITLISNSDFRRPPQKTTAQWTSILHLAAK